MLQDFWERQKERQNSSQLNTAEEELAELTLTLEVIDILDELKIMLVLLNTQARVLRSFHEAMSKFKPDNKPSESERPAAQQSIIVHHGEISITNLSISNQGGITTPLVDRPVSGKAGAFICDAEDTLKLTIENVQSIRDDVLQTQTLVRTYPCLPVQKVNICTTN